MLYVQNNNIKMDSFELNKIIAAILMVALLIIGLSKIADGVFQVNKPEKPGYKVEVENQSSTISSKSSEEVKKIESGKYMIQYQMKDRTMTKAPPISNATENKGRVVVDVNS